MDGQELGFRGLDPGDERRTTLDVEGTLPGWLDGALIRNGPGTFAVGECSVDHWFDGLAMLQRYGFDGEGVTYRNRFLRTDAYERARRGEFEGGFATGESTLRERLAALLFEGTYDNANVVAERVGDRYLAFTETPRRVAFDPETLATLGDVEHPGAGQLACAHLQRDPRTDALVTFETAFGRPSRYRVYELHAPGRREPVGTVEADEVAYMHSFALTPNYVVLTEFPFVVDPLTFLAPGRQGPFVENFRWEPERGTRFVVMDRGTGEVVAEPRTEAFFGFHHVNAYEDGTDLVVDLETVPDAEAVAALDLERLRAGDLDAFAGKLDRFRVESPWSDPSVSRRELYEGGTALPTVSPDTWLGEHRYVYAQSTDQPVTEWPHEVLKFDVRAGDAATYSAGEHYLGEPIFVPRPGGDREDDGVVLTVQLDVAAERSRLLVLDAGEMTERARATLPHAVPFDFHGRYFPEL